MFSEIQEKKNEVRTKLSSFLNDFSNLNLSGLVNSMRSELTKLVNNGNVFSDKITSQLITSPSGVPYHITAEDPEQIALVKKITNILYNVETILASLEAIKLTDEMYTVELMGHAPEVFKQSLKAIELIGDVMQLVNNSSASIQAIMGPQLKSLEPAYSYMMAQVAQFTPSGFFNGVEQQIGNAMGQAVNLLPSNRSTGEGITLMDLTTVINYFPNYFTQLHSVIENESLSPLKRISSNEDAVVNKLQKRANSISNALHNDSNNSGLGQRFKMLKELGNLSVEIVNTALPATKEAYLKVVEKLDQFRYELLPLLISELESLEESLGLKSGTLTDKALEAANIYYQELESILEEMVEVAELMDDGLNIGNKWYIEVPKNILLGSGLAFDAGKILEKKQGVNVLIDSKITEAREKNQLGRLDAAKIQLHEIEGSAEAANAFYTKIGELSQSMNDGQLSSLPAKEKQELAFHYKKFQPYMAAKNPELDNKIVSSLKLSPNELEQLHPKAQEPASYSSSFWNVLGTVGAVGLYVAQNMAGGNSPSFTTQENEFTTLLNTQDKVNDSLIRAMSTQELRISLINDTIIHSELFNYTQSNQKTVLNESAKLPTLTQYQYVKTVSADDLYQQSLVIDS